jgi:cysteine desulfurase/selenocysteine lyase
MSTSDDDVARLAAVVMAAEVPAELRGSVLDPSVLGHIATELFRARPGELGVAVPTPPSVPSAGASPTQLASAATPSAIPGAPADVRAPGPASLGRATPTAIAQPVTVPLSPTLDASLLPWIASGVPSTGGLDALPTMPGSALPSFDAFGTGLAPSSAASALPSARSTTSLGHGLDRAGAAVPPVPVASAPPSSNRAAESLYFLDRGAAHPSAASVPSESPGTSPTLVPHLGLAPGAFDPVSVRRDFPILSEVVHGKRLVWLDNAATTQKPRAVIDRISEFYERENSNIHRAAHTLAARATDAYEAARDKVRRFLHAPSTRDIVFVRGTTEGINLIAQGWGRRNVGPGDEIVLTTLEHHSNIVPWQLLAAEKGARLRVAPVDDTGQILLDEYEKLFNARTKIASFTHVSNALGTVTPVREMIEIAHRHGVRTVLDGAQSISHMPIDVRALDTDFFVFSGHKVFGPTGIGVVYGKPEVIESMPPWQGGGNMIVDVTFEKTVYAPSPARFEAGTGNIADAVGLGAALDYLDALGMENVARHEHDLLVYGTECLRSVPGLRFVGTAKEKAAVLGFVLDGFKSEEVGAALDRDGIAVRSGHHCAQPALRRFGLETSVRPSLAIYNDKSDIDALVTSLKHLAATRRG